MKLRCVVIDDERPARRKLERLIARHDDLELVGQAEDADAAVALIDAERPDLCLLDVRMPEGDGFEVLQRIAHRPHVVFTTAYDDYAVRAFEVNSVDYLLKPFGARRFDEAIERVRERIKSAGDPGARIAALLESMQAGAAPGDAEPAAAAPRRITGRRGTKIVLLDPAEVLWCEAEETLIFARTDRGRFLVERTLADLERELSPDFFRSHRRYLVNLGRIREILPGEAGTYRIVMRDEPASEVPLSRRQARRLRELFPW